jgi:hypothetical protein
MWGEISVCWEGRIRRLMLVEHPSDNEVAALRDDILRAWAQQPAPTAAQAVLRDDPGPPDEFFIGKDWRTIELEDPEQYGDCPLANLHSTAAVYFTPAYLLHCLDIQRHLASPCRRCWSTPSDHLITFLAFGERSMDGLLRHPYSPEQLACVRDFLRLVLKYPEFYGAATKLGESGLEGLLERLEHLA